MAYSFLDLAEEVLKSVSVPLTYQQCWEEGQAKGLTAPFSIADGADASRLHHRADRWFAARSVTKKGHYRLLLISLKAILEK